MSLSPGTKLGRYEVVAPLGAGGMGEVYRGRDALLGREVAVKVLPVAVARSPLALERFESEARAVAALSHPSILAIFDVGETDGTRFVVTELLEGQTLRATLVRGAVPVRRALDLVLPVAEALAAVHEKGIVHCDVKPENVFLVAGGGVKLLDFGIAARCARANEPGDERGMPTAPILAGTAPHGGTVSYMSPEQARGEAVDFRSDQFSLGVVLYEALAGVRPFLGSSAPDVLAAILREEPRPLSSVEAPVPAPVRWIVERLLSKEPGDRYDSTRDLVRDLSAARTRLSAPDESAGPATAAWRARVPRAVPALWTLVLVAVAALGTGVLLEKGRLAPPQPTFRRLTFQRGWVGGARFTGDGQTVVYGARWDGQPAEVYSVRLDAPESRPLGMPEAALLSVSSSSELALLLGSATHRPGSPPGVLARVPFSGGAPRALAADVRDADFTPDGESLAAVREAPGGGMQLEFPLGTVLHRVERGDSLSHPRVSPDGDELAFIECSRARGACAVAVVGRDGEKSTLSAHAREVEGLAWDASGRELWFGAARTGWRHEVRAVRLDGQERLVLGQVDSLVPHDVDRWGRLLVTRVESRTRIVFRSERDAAGRDLSWLDRSTLDDLSTDGRQIVFRELSDATAGRSVVYVRSTDGAPAVKLGDGGFSTFSADGRSVLSVLPGGNGFVQYPLGPEVPRTVHLPGFYVDAPRLLADGRTVLFNGTDGPSREPSVFRTDLGGSAPVPVTPAGVRGVWPFATPDGRFVIARSGETLELHPLDGGAPLVLDLLAPEETVVGWAKDGRSLLAARLGGQRLDVVRVHLGSARRELWRSIETVEAPGGPVALRLTPDGWTYVYGVQRPLADLHLAEGLR